MEGGRENNGCGEEYHVEKRIRGSIIVLPLILRLLVRNQVRKRGRKGKENQDFKI